jgi:hypothetical protein
MHADAQKNSCAENNKQAAKDGRIEGLLQRELNVLDC